MVRHRIAVGLDASEPARHALWWAVREAARSDGGVLVVTAWTAAQRATARETEGLYAARLRLQHMQRQRIAEAVAGLDPAPPIARMLVLAEPVTALCHAARFADVIALGGRGRSRRGGRSTPVSVARRLDKRRRAGATPTVVVAVDAEEHLPSMMRSAAATRTQTRTCRAGSEISPDRPGNTHRDITQPVPTALVEPPPVITVGPGRAPCVTAG